MVDEEDAQEDVDAAIEKMLQLRGVTNREPEALQLLETDFDGNSRVVSGLRQKKDGSFYEYSKVADRAELEALGGFARKKAAEIAERMQKGECAVLPYQVGQEGSCDFCPYKTVCGFDPKIAGYRMQRLRKKELSDLMPEEGEGA